MPERLPSEPIILARIHRLERQLHRARLIGLGLGASGILILMGFTAGRQQVLRAERLELVTSGGARQAILQADSIGFSITVLDRRERPSGGLHLSLEPRLEIRDDRGREVAELGAPRPHHLTE